MGSLHRIPLLERRAAHKAELLAALPIPEPYEVDGVRIKIWELRFEPATGCLVVYLSAARGNQVLLEHDEDHRVYNPPLMIPDPGGRVFAQYHPRLGHFERELHVEDLPGALKQLVADIVFTTLHHRGL
jgi:hypothetical protein